MGWFRVWGLGFREFGVYGVVSSLGFMGWFRVWGLGFREFGVYGVV